MLIITHRASKEQHHKCVRQVYKSNLFLSVPGDNAGAVIEVTGIREGGERPYRVVAGELRQTLHEIIQLVQVSAFLWTQQTHTIKILFTRSNGDMNYILCYGQKRGNITILTAEGASCHILTINTFSRNLLACLAALKTMMVSFFQCREFSSETPTLWEQAVRFVVNVVFILRNSKFSNNTGVRQTLPPIHPSSKVNIQS